MGPSQESSTPPPTTPLVEVVIKDELSGRGSARLQEIMGEALALRPAQIVVDLSDCETLDAAALDVLLDTHRRMWRAGGQLTLRGPSARLQRILSLARVDHVFNITHARSLQRPAERRSRAPMNRTAAERP